MLTPMLGGPKYHKLILFIIILFIFFIMIYYYYLFIYFIYYYLVFILFFYLFSLPVEYVYFSDFDEFTVIGQCMLMYIAGTETTGNTLSFLLYELALHQDVQDKLRDEINTMLKKISGELTSGEFNTLPYMDQVISGKIL